MLVDQVWKKPTWFHNRAKSILKEAFSFLYMKKSLSLVMSAFQNQSKFECRPIKKKSYMIDFYKHLFFRNYFDPLCIEGKLVMHQKFWENLLFATTVVLVTIKVWLLEMRYCLGRCSLISVQFSSKPTEKSEFVWRNSNNHFRIGVSI